MLSDNQNPPKIRYSGRFAAIQECTARLLDLIDAHQVSATVSGFNDTQIEELTQVVTLLNLAIGVVDPEIETPPKIRVVVEAALGMAYVTEAPDWVQVEIVGVDDEKYDTWA